MMSSLPIVLFSREPPLFQPLRSSSTNSQCCSASSSPRLTSALAWRKSRSSPECQILSYQCSREVSTNFYKGRVLTRKTRKKTCTTATRRLSVPMVQARLFGPAIFELSKLRVLVLLAKEEDENERLQLQEEPRIYTVTHSDVTAQITLTVAREINDSQLGGWYRRLQRDEVLAEWRKRKGIMSLHVHCHISGGDNFLHNLIAKLRFYIFQKELPVVLQAFMVGDRQLFRKHPELNYARVWVYFHSSLLEYNRVECWGPLVEAIQRRPTDEKKEEELPGSVCATLCDCCSRHASVVPVPESSTRLLLVVEERQRPHEF